MTDFKWYQFDQLNKPIFFDIDDLCYYAREHKNGGYEISESNQLIFNFKKPITKRNSTEWCYKKHSIRKFSTELSALNIPIQSVLIPAVTSNPRNSKNFDSRLEDVIKDLRTLDRGDLYFQPILDVKNEILPSHYAGSKFLNRKN